MLPDFIANANLQRVLFRLLAHEQLTVREQAKMAMTGLLARSPFAVIEKCFLAMIAKLDMREDQEDGKTGGSREEDLFKLSKPSSCFLDAYEAEGLISVCDILVNELPFNYVLASWTAFSPTFENYLAHPASTVRQVPIFGEFSSSLRWLGVQTHTRTLSFSGCFIRLRATFSCIYFLGAASIPIRPAC